MEASEREIIQVEIDFHEKSCSRSVNRFNWSLKSHLSNPRKTIRMGRDEHRRKRRHASLVRAGHGKGCNPEASGLRGKLIFPVAVAHFLFYDWFTFTFYFLQKARTSLLKIFLHQFSLFQWEVDISDKLSRIWNIDAQSWKCNEWLCIGFK